MTIKVWEYLDEYEVEKKEVWSAINEVLSSGRLILGQNVKAFESKFAEYCGVKYGVGVNSGTDALFLALKALNIGEGDEVITVSNTAVPTVSAIVSTGARPKFVDIYPNTYLMDTSNIEKVITHKTKCILPVHLFGQCVEMDSILSIAKKHNLYVIEDCAQSHGATFKQQKAGSMGDLAAFSFYPTKILGGYGDGGIVITNKDDLYKKLVKLRFYGMEKTYYSLEHGYNSRLDELHAAILLKKLNHINDYLVKRRRIAEVYFKNLKDNDLVLPYEHKLGLHAYYIFVCRHKKRDIIISELADKDIIVNISYPWPIHTMKGYKYLGYKKGDLPNTEAAASEIFSLPMFPSLTLERQTIVIESIKKILKDLS